MIVYASLIAMTMVGLALLLNLYRLLRGPDPIDRILALDTMTTNVVGIVLIGGVLFNTALNFEIALLIALVGFISTVAFCKYLMRGDLIE
ncbi:multisubunit potassium/proton antiporter, PhaF subunit [Arboricoccus pini]|uniref:Multisubunit potassium/proton antiporter, PhaF subunit n=1 Tax=Arboricoccus pini TaxID=1963835 RepID=A0A212Q2Y0_9PROT|nr:K+/H+ antiporter subunit F [Arboricoccus pini]SNB53630.1 multisubunit potassium/proton antiporter, PhaF subunit [Arboricoccus pini]